MKKNLKILMTILILLHIFADIVPMIRAFIDKDFDGAVMYILFIIALVVVLILYLCTGGEKKDE